MTNTQRITTAIGLCFVLFGVSPESAFAGFPDGPPTKCAPDAVLSGSRCIDMFEASVWRVPAPTGVNKGLVKKIRQGKATREKLLAAGATLLGASNAIPYTPCEKYGANCTDIFALSLPGVEPSRVITWFQAQQACKNVGKQLPRNDDWQAAVIGTPDPGPDNGTTDCNTLGDGAAPTGSRSACVSNDGAFDMVGNLYEWTAEWVTRTSCGGSWNVVTDDSQCLTGSALTTGEPGAIVRGGSYDVDNSTAAGPLTIRTFIPSLDTTYVGFRCIR